MAEATRLCRTCGKTKLVEAFNWANRSQGRRQSTCRSCFREYNRRRYLEKGDQIRAAARAYHWANRTQIVDAKRAAYWRDVEASRAANRANAAVQNAKPERKAAKRAWAQADRMANPEKWRAKSRRDYETGATAILERAHRRRALMKGSRTAVLTAARLRQKWDFWAGCCWLCGGQASEWDHVKPLSKGGAHVLANLRPACRSCNAQKNARWPLAA